jgi:hypothetical protein
MSAAKPLKWKAEPDGDGFYWLYQPSPDRVLTVARIWTERERKSESYPGYRVISFEYADRLTSVSKLANLLEHGGYFFMGPLQRPGSPKFSTAAEHDRWIKYCQGGAA